MVMHLIHLTLLLYFHLTHNLSSLLQHKKKQQPNPVTPRLFIMHVRWGSSLLEVVSLALRTDSVSGAMVLLVTYQWRTEVFKSIRWLLV